MGVDREGGDTAAYGQVGRGEDKNIILLCIGVLRGGGQGGLGPPLKLVKV